MVSIAGVFWRSVRLLECLVVPSGRREVCSRAATLKYLVTANDQDAF